jgi:hypothetical protein
LFEKNNSFRCLIFFYQTMLLLGILCAQENKLLRGVFVAASNVVVL